MKCTKIVGGVEIETNIYQLQVEGGYENLYYELGSDGNRAYLRFSPDNHPCTEMSILDRENLLMLTNALLHISSELEKIVDEVQI